MRLRLPTMRSLKTAAIAGVVLFLGVVTALGMPATTNLLYAGLQPFPAISPSELDTVAAGPATAIVILSAGWHPSPEYGAANGGNSVDALALERVRYGAYLARQTHLPVLLSGGSVRGSPVLAGLLADVLQSDFGIKPHWLEERSTTTAENAIYSAEMLKREGIGRVLLVTHAWHMKRARAAFAANGMVVVPAPTAFYRAQTDPWQLFRPNITSFLMSRFALHEIIGSVWYDVRYGYR